MAVTTININSLLGAVLFSYSADNNSISKALNAFFSNKRGEVIEYIDLSNQDITGVDFGEIKFHAGKFSGSTITSSNFANTSICSSDLTGVVISNSYLFNCNVKETTFKGSTLRKSLLQNVKFNGIDCDTITFQNNTLKNTQFVNCKFENCTVGSLSLDNLTAGYLISNNQLSILSDIKADFISILSNFTPVEKAALRQIMVSGGIDGSTYEGTNANLLGTLANIRNVEYIGLSPNFNRSGEMWFYQVQVGNNQLNNSVVILAIQWIDGN